MKIKKPKLKIEAAAILNEDKPEFFAELMSKGVDAIEPEMRKQLYRINEDNMTEAMNEASRIICFKEGFNSALDEVEKIHKYIDESFNGTDKTTDYKISELGIYKYLKEKINEMRK